MNKEANEAEVEVLRQEYRDSEKSKFGYNPKRLENPTPCPFCWGHDILFAIMGPRIFAYCCRCGSQAPDVEPWEGLNAAAALWNGRTIAWNQRNIRLGRGLWREGQPFNE